MMMVMMLEMIATANKKNKNFYDYLVKLFFLEFG